MNTLGDKTGKNAIPREGSYNLALRFKAATNAVKRGMHVMFNVAGEVLLHDGTKPSLGYVTVGCKGVYDELDVTVQTGFTAEKIGIASGAVAAGDYVIPDGIDNTTTY